jgi:16S rRNA (guanine527-N7)-methyltransferase
MNQIASLPSLADLWQQTLGWQPDAWQVRQFQRLYELVIAGNQQLNLTRITEPMEFWEKHLWDSLRGIKHWLGANGDLLPERMIDIGTGGGFPGVPVAIALPATHVTLLDSTQKKIAFLNTVTQSLGITNATPLTGRAEDIGQQNRHRAGYDLALLRAIAPPSVCAEYALPLLAIGGTAILYRGQWTAEESNTLNRAVAKLGGEVTQIEAFTTPLSQSVRHLVFLKKLTKTPRTYPRTAGVPTRQPLGIDTAETQRAQKDDASDGL